MSSSATYTLQAIGHVRSTLTHRADAPRQGDEGAPAAWLEFSPAVQDGLRNLRVGDDVLVLTWLTAAVATYWPSIRGAMRRRR